MKWGWILSSMLLFNVLCITISDLDLVSLTTMGLCCEHCERRMCLAEAISDLWDVWGSCIFNNTFYIGKDGDDETCDTSWRRPCASINGIL